jgi:hypothetical protein
MGASASISGSLWLRGDSFSPRVSGFLLSGKHSIARPATGVLRCDNGAGEQASCEQVR